MQIGEVYEGEQVGEGECVHQAQLTDGPHVKAGRHGPLKGPAPGPPLSLHAFQSEGRRAE